jgi:hypothetical protein
LQNSKKSISNPKILNAMKKIFLIISIAMVFVACTKKEDATPAVERMNQNQPIGNNLVLNQRLIGDTIQPNTIHRMLDAGDGGFYFAGVQNNNYVIGKISASGTYLWTQRIGFQVNSMAVVNQNLVICYKNIISFYKLSGAYEKEIAINASGNISVNDIQQYSSGLLFVGKIEQNFQNLPVYGLLTYVNNVPQINGKILTTMPSYEFTAIPTQVYTISNNDDYGASSTAGGNTDIPTPVKGTSSWEKPTNTSFFALARQLSNNIGQQIAVCSIQTDQVVWKRDLGIGVTDSRIGQGTAVIVNNESVYVSGYSVDLKNDNPDSNNKLWGYGFVACVNANNGSLLWQKTHRTSQFSDNFSMLIVTRNKEIYTCGYSSSYLRTISKKSFGYGLLARINPINGDMISYKTFGDETKSSRFNYLYLKDNQLFAVGYANQNYSTSGFQAWFVEINKNF